jgi:hypothetical protein
MGRQQIRRSSSFGHEADLHLQQDPKVLERKEDLYLGTEISNSSSGYEQQSLVGPLKKLHQSPAVPPAQTMDFITRMDMPGFPFALLETVEEKKETPADVIPLRQKQEAQTSKAVALISSCFRELQEVRSSFPYLCSPLPLPL